MRDIALDIRMELFRVQPKLSVQHGEHLVQDIPRCFRDITNDDTAHGVTEWRDFFNFSLVDRVAVVTIYRKTGIEVFVFAADESLIHATEHLALVDVAEFLQTVRGRFPLPDVGLISDVASIAVAGESLVMDETWPNYALQRTRPSRYCCNRGVSWAGSLSLGRSAARGEGACVCNALVGPC